MNYKRLKLNRLERLKLPTTREYCLNFQQKNTCEEKFNTTVQLLRKNITVVSYSCNFTIVNVYDKNFLKKIECFFFKYFVLGGKRMKHAKITVLDRQQLVKTTRLLSLAQQR